jgi:hypothetical protein
MLTSIMLWGSYFCLVLVLLLALNALIYGDG